MNTDEAIAAFLIGKRARGLSARTIEGYHYRLGLFAKAYPRLPEAPTELEKFLASQGPTLETRDTYYRLLRNFYRWIRRRGLTDSNPFDRLDAPILRRKVARAFSDDELRRILAYPHRPHHIAFLYFLFDTGARLSETWAIDGQHHFGDGVVLVEGKTGEREVPVSPEVRKMVLDVLPWPWASRDAAGLAVRRAIKQAGIDGSRASAQTIRHTFVRRWEGDETVLIGIMGWTSGAMLRVYRPYNLNRARSQHRQNSLLRRVVRTPQPLL